MRVLYGVAGLARPSTVQQHGCASARRSLGWSSRSWKAVSEHSALQGLRHRQKMWKGKRKIKLACTKSTTKLGIEKNPRVLELRIRNYPVGKVAPAVWHFLALVFCMSLALVISLPMPSCISTHSLMASVSGPPGKREALLLE